MLLTDFHYKLIADLEHKYGNLYNVPEDDVKLKIIRDRINKSPRPDKFENTDGISKHKFSDLNVRTKRYNVRYLKAIYDERIKGKSLREIAKEFRINQSSLDSLYRFIGFERYPAYYANITDRDILLSSSSTGGLAEKLKKTDRRFKKITRNIISTNMYNVNKYKKVIEFDRNITYKKITEDDIKKTIFKHAKSKSKLNNEQLIDKLNNQNGEGVFTLEEVNRWNRG